MSSNNLIELNQQGSGVQINANGDFSLNIAENMTINPGDSLVLNKVFIDTTSAQTNKIELDEDTEITVAFNFWVCDCEPINKRRSGFLDPPTWIAGGNQSGQIGLQVEKMATSNTTEIYEINFDWKPGGGKKFGGIPCAINYTDCSDQPRVYHLQLDSTDITQGLVYTQLVNTIYTKQDTPINFSLDTVKGNIGQIDATTRNTTTNPIWRPVQESKSITIPKGKYDPSELASYMSEQMQLGFTASTTGIPNLIPSNTLLKTATTDDIFIYDEASTKANSLISVGCFGYAANNQTYIGTNSFALEWDSSFNKFKFSNIHFPAYNQNGQITILELPVGPDWIGGQPVSLVTAYSGIFIADLQPVTFWQDSLGIVPADVCTHFPTYDYNNNILPAFEWLPGTNTTNQLMLMDGSVQKNPSYCEVPVNIASILSTNTNEIVATQQILENSVTNSHFFVEINSCFKNNLIDSTNNYRNIMGIIGTYYSIGSFTSGSSADSLMYTHEGSPVQLSSFDVRILDGSHNLAGDLGERNVVFLQIIKAPDPTQDKALLPSDVRK
jgi:hypothetical protein